MDGVARENAILPPILLPKWKTEGRETKQFNYHGSNLAFGWERNQRKNLLGLGDVGNDMRARRQLHSTHFESRGLTSMDWGSCSLPNQECDIHGVSRGPTRQEDDWGRPTNGRCRGRAARGIGGANGIRPWAEQPVGRGCYEYDDLGDGRVRAR